MLTVNSLSGGKTSSFLEKHYPADISVFALVCMDDHNSNAGSTTLKVDKYIRQIVNDKLQRFCSDQHEFVCTAEDPIIIKTMLDLEQHTGREIIWLRGKGFQPASFGKGMLPNKKHRWCTTIFKIEPIFNFLFRYHSLPVKMRIGYRSDEAHRVNNFRDTYIMSTHCEIKYPGEPIGNFKVARLPYKGSLDYFTGTSLPHRHRWKEVPFRIGEFPLIEAGITQYDVQKYWQDKDVTFPEDSNCQFCFWKHPQQLRKNFDNQPGIMYSAVVLEDMQESTLRADLSMLQIKNIAPQMDLFQMRGGGCQGGYCTD